MAKINILVEGLSGTGKSSVCDELIRRGYAAINTDATVAYFADPKTGKPGGEICHENFVWDRQKISNILTDDLPELLFVCGSGRNRDDFLKYFKMIFNLCIDDATMKKRLKDRTNNDFGKKAEEFNLMLELNRKNEKPKNAIDIDATRPLEEVVDTILEQALACTEKN